MTTQAAINAIAKGRKKSTVIALEMDSSQRSLPVEAIAAATNAGSRPILFSLKGRVYSKSELGFFRRIVHVWDARVIGWLTARERVRYTALANAIYNGSLTAFKELHELRVMARYANGRLPGCERYTSVAIARTYATHTVTVKGEVIRRATAKGDKQPCAHPLTEYHFQVTPIHHLVLRLRRKILKAYLRIERQGSPRWLRRRHATSRHCCCYPRQRPAITRSV